MKCWIISDTHSLHGYLKVPENIDLVIHCGDSTNYYDLNKNTAEFDDFIYWFYKLDIKHKVLISGNHDAWGTKQYNIDKVKDSGIIYLEHEYAEIEGKLIFGSPYTCTFNNWYFMKDRSKISRYWEALIDGIDILVTHGPPKSILDLSHNQLNELEYCGDNSLLKKVLAHKPKVHCFGHIHNSPHGDINQGIRIYQDIKFINASCVTDGKFSLGTTSNGIIIDV